MLIQINDNVGKVHDKIDAQNKKLTEIEVKVDFYRESQNELNRKHEETSKTATAASTTARENSKRLDRIEKIIGWVASIIVGGVLIALIALVLKK